MPLASIALLNGAGYW